MVDKKVVRMEYVGSKLQIANIFPKPVEENQFFKLKFILVGW